MGLDVSHLQLTLSPQNKDDYYCVNEWDLDCNVSIKHYEKYITTIDDVSFNKSIAIVKDEEDLQKLKETEWYGGTNYAHEFLGELDDAMRQQIARFAAKQKLDKLETLQLNHRHDDVSYQTISFGEPIQIQGVYYNDDIGYQQKGMNDLFYKKFEAYSLWGNKEDFDLAYACVSDDWYLEHWGQAAVDRMKRNFNENFVDKFEFGKSLLSVSF